MRISGTIGLLIGLVCSFAHAGLPVAVGGEPLPSLAPMLEQVMPAVVNVSTRGEVSAPEHPLLSDPFFRRFFGYPDPPRRRDTRSLGSGVIVDAAHGYILTNHHVISEARDITVTLKDGRQLAASVVGIDPNTDIAVVKVKAENLTAVPPGNSDELRVGDFVVAIGNPFDLGQTVTSGIVSALGRSGLGIRDYEDFIQTDASINPGNSGGALVNLRGELVGINTAIFAPSGGNIGIGFAIPSNMARDIMTQLVSFGKVRRGLLGVAMQDLTPALAEAFGLSQPGGAVIVRIKPNSPAALAGLQAGDVVVSVNGQPVRSAAEVHNVLGLLHVGDRVRFEVIRDGRRRRVEAKLAEREEPALAAEELHPRLSGAVLADIVQGMTQFGRVEGVLVAEVEPDSSAAAAGLRDGDVLTAVNRIRVRNLDEVRQVLARRPRTLVLRIQRGSSTVYVLIQ